MSTSISNATFNTPGGPEAAKDMLRKHSHQLLVEIAINLIGVVLQGYALYVITPKSPYLHYLGVGFLALWVSAGMLDSQFDVDRF